MNNMDSFLDIMIFFAGAYLIYSAFIMKTKGEVASSLLSRNIDWKHVKEENKKAYIKVMIPANIVMGITMILISGVFVFGDRIGLSGTGVNILIAVALLICIAYGAIIMNYQGKYLK